jgi:hypothetical protein
VLHTVGGKRGGFRDEGNREGKKGKFRKEGGWEGGGGCLIELVDLVCTIPIGAANKAQRLNALMSK